MSGDKTSNDLFAKQRNKIALLDKRVVILENRLERLVEGVRRGLPHMNLAEFLDDPK